MKHIVLCLVLSLGMFAHIQLKSDYLDIDVMGEPYLIGWRVAAYKTPGFTSGPVLMLDAGWVTVLARRNDGWALVSARNNFFWIYTSENRVFVPYRTRLFANKEDSRPSLYITPQVVDVRRFVGDWALIETWQGEQWMRIRDILPGGAGAIALTFDDGPVFYTQRLLDELYVRGVSATFFTTGRNVAANPRLAARIVNEGHEIACHAHSHARLVNLSEEGVRRELTNSRNAIYNATGTHPVLLRPPYGNHNNMVRSVAREFGMPLITWNIDTLDWRDRDIETILSRVVDARGNAIVQNGDIILMHDTSNISVDAAIRMVDVLLGLGFRFVTVSELFEVNGITPEPGGVYRIAR